MGAFADKISELTMTVRSPDKTVVLTTRGYTPGIRIDPDGLRKHTEVTLAHQVTSVMRLAVAGLQQAHNQTMNLILGYEKSTPANEPASRLLETYQGRLDGLQPLGTSAKGHVRIRRVKGRDYEVLIHPGALTALNRDPEKVANELASAMAATRDDYGRKVRELRKQVFGNDIEHIGQE